MEIPSQIRFDVLVIIIAIGSIFLPIYFKLSLPFVLIFGGVGAGLFLVGASYIKLDYDLYEELRNLEYAKKKVEYLEFFKGKKYLTKESKEQHENDIKDMVNKRI